MPFAGAVIGFAIGASVGLVASVDYVGDKQGANGSVLGTSLGFVGGIIALGTFETIAERARWKVPGSVNVLLGLVTLVGGPVIGYHLTADRDGGSSARIPIVGFVF